jgi:hypothetical protein
VWQACGECNQIEVGRTHDHHIECIVHGHAVVPFLNVAGSSLAA